MPSDPLIAQAQAAESSGDLRAAANLYQLVLQRDASSSEAHAGLANLLPRAGQHERAMHHAQTAVRLDPSNARAHHTLALLLAAGGDLDGALASHNTARSLDPGFAAAHVDAAMLLEMRADAGAAREAAGEALASDPDDQRARILATRLDFRAGEPEGERLEGWRRDLGAIADAPENPVTRALALDVLIDVCERLGDYDAAWEAITRCNDADRTITGAALPSAEQRGAKLKAYEVLARFMTPERGARWRDERPDDGLPAPALLVGFPRSGTTMTERALDAHPGLTSIEERPTFQRVARRIPEVVPASLTGAYPGAELLDHLTPEHVGRLRSMYWEHACAALGAGAPPSDSLVLDKLPLRIADLPFVNRVFPEARVLVALRDPRDVCLSCVRQRFGYAGNVPISFFLDAADTASLYAAVMRTWLATRSMYSTPTLEIHYEDTVAEFETRIRAMLGFLGLEFDEAVLSFHRRTDRMHNTPSYHAVRQKVSTRAVGRWKRYETHLAPILPTLQPFVEAFGYS